MQEVKIALADELEIERALRLSPKRGKIKRDHYHYADSTLTKKGWEHGFFYGSETGYNTKILRIPASPDWEPQEVDVLEVDR